MILRAMIDDIPAIISLQESVAKENAIFGYIPDSKEDWTKRDLTWTLLATRDNKPVGFIHGAPRIQSGECVFPADSRILEIMDLVVAVDARHEGVGSDLVSAIQTQARSQGFTHLRVYSAAKRFDDIVGFYRRCGFAPWYVEMTQDLSRPDRHQSS